MDKAQSSYEDEIDLEELLRVIWSRKLFIATFIILTSALAYILIKQMPNIYRANAVIMLKSSTQSADPIQSLITGSITAADNTETELQLIKSKSILSNVVENLNLARHPAFSSTLLNKEGNTSVVKKSSFELALADLSKNVSVQQTSGTDLIRISYDSYYPELAALVANTIGITFVKYKENLMAGTHKQGSALLVTKLEDVKKSLTIAEKRIVEYQEEHNFTDITNSVVLANRKLTQLHNQKDALTSSIEQANIVRQHIVNNIDDMDSLLSLPIFANSNSLQQHEAEVKKLSQRFSEIKLRYGFKHPKYISSEKLLNSTKQELIDQVKHQLAKIDKQIEIEIEKVAYFDGEIKSLTKRINHLGFIEFDFVKLKREFEANLALYESLVKKQNESELMEDLTNSSNTILIESADTPRNPVKPNRKLLFVLSVLASFMIACFVVLIEFLLGNKTIQFRKMAPKFGTKVIGAVPKIKMKKLLRKGVITDLEDDKYAGFIESIRSIRTSILLDKVRSKHKVIAITSISPNDGKSSLSLQLSKCFAEVGETVLVDADLRFPSIAKALQQEAERPGLTNLIADSHSFESSIYKPFKYKFDVVTSGKVPKNPLVFLQHQRFKKVLSELKTRYQRVILECPPIMSVSDAFVVSKCVDSVYLVVDSTKANTSVLANVLEELQQAEVEVGGIILNKVKDSKAYGSKNYYNYYRRIPQSD